MTEAIRKNFSYDPARQGYDTNQWVSTMGGTVTATAGRLVLSHSIIVNSGDMLKGDVTFNATFASNLSTASVGLYKLGRGAYLLFKLTGGSLYAAASDGVTSSSTLTGWDSNWNATNIVLRIRWESGTARFYINDVCIATLAGDSIPREDLALFLYDSSATSSTFGAIEVKAISYEFHDKSAATIGISSLDINIMQAVGVAGVFSSNRESASNSPSLSPSASSSPSSSPSSSKSPSSSPSSSESPSVSPSIAP